MRPFKAVVAEPSDVVRRTLGHLLRSRGVTTAEAPTLSDAQAYLDADDFDVLIASLDQADGAGDAFLRNDARRVPQRIRVLMWPDSRGPTPSASIEFQEVLTKPFSDIEVRDLLQRLRQRFEGRGAADSRNSNPVSESQPLSDVHRRPILGQSTQIFALQQLIQQVAQTDATVLIQGESGTGKELIARALHAQSQRARGPFISLNCAALPDSLIESELFGHEKGSFTGALARREGRFELANGGTLLLDEVTEVSAAVQAKLLRVLQEREFERVGGNRAIRVNVRVVATSNRNLESAIAAGHFREDLYFRLNVVPIHVPPLRERTGDVVILAEHFLAQFRAKHQSHASGFTRSALALLESHSWPGNVRELQNVIERAVITTPTPLIEVNHLAIHGRGSPLRLMPTPHRLVPTPSTSRIDPPRSILVEPVSPILNNTVKPLQPPASLDLRATVPEPAPMPAKESKSSAAETSTGTSFTPRPLEAVVRQHILATIQHTRGNRNQAARLLRINIRTLRNKLISYGRRAEEELEPSNNAAARVDGARGSHRSENLGPHDP